MQGVCGGAGRAGGGTGSSSVILLNLSPETSSLSRIVAVDPPKPTTWGQHQQHHRAMRSVPRTVVR